MCGGSYVVLAGHVIQVAQHRDVIQTEYARVNVAKGKLENLCRELQKHSKAVAVCVCVCVLTGGRSSYTRICMFVHDTGGE